MSKTLHESFDDEGAIVAGVLSGTSADGIDVVIARIRKNAAGDDIEQPQPIAFATLPYPDDVRSRVRSVLDGAHCGLRETALLSRDLGRAFGRAARILAEHNDVELDLVGSHGQTVWHHDGNEASGAATLQLGDGDFVAEETRCTVVSDFRQRDIAAGGEGAPISALADDVIFARVPRPCAILNLGGMGNLTVLQAVGPRESGRPAEPDEPTRASSSERSKVSARSNQAADPLAFDHVLAFDTGPANSLLDGLARRLLAAPCDGDGASAARGTVDEALLREWSAHPFFLKPPPRSTGRDTFGEAWVGDVIDRARKKGLLEHGPDDLMATATAFVAHTVADSLSRFVQPRAQRLVVAGGGVHNGTLMLQLYERCRIPVGSSDAAGVDPDAREALVFAVLAARCILGRPVTRTGATGARAGRILGKISPG